MEIDANGWIKIESKKDYPKENGFYFFRLQNNQTGRTFIKKITELTSYEMLFLTHYQPIIKPELPII